MDSEQTFGGELPVAEAVSSVSIPDAADDYSYDEHEDDVPTLASLLRALS